MEGMVWLDCDRHGLARIGRSGPGRDDGHIENLVDQEGSVELCVAHGGYRMTADGVGARDCLG